MCKEAPNFGYIEFMFEGMAYGYGAKTHKEQEIQYLATVRLWVAHQQPWRGLEEQRKETHHDRVCTT